MIVHQDNSLFRRFLWHAPILHQILQTNIKVITHSFWRVSRSCAQGSNCSCFQKGFPPLVDSGGQDAILKLGLCLVSHQLGSRGTEDSNWLSLLLSTQRECA